MKIKTVSILMILVVSIIIIVTTAINTSPAHLNCSLEEILAPSDFNDPKDGIYSAQYARLNWMINALYFLSQQGDQKYDFPGANIIEDTHKDNGNIYWTDIFNPIGVCVPTKTVQLMETANRLQIINSVDFENLVGFLRDKLSYQETFKRDLHSRKIEWKKAFNGKPYVSFHMRRTDKVGTESTYCSAIQYLSYMLSENNKEWPEHIFIMTDDPRAVDEVKMFLPDNGSVAVHSAAEYTRAIRGHPVHRGWVIDSFAELEIAAEADLLVVQMGSNVATSFKLFRYARKQQETIIKPIVATDTHIPIHIYWERINNNKRLQVCPLVEDFELKALAMACDMPWWRYVVSIQHDGLQKEHNNNIFGVDKITSAIETLIDSVAVLAHGLIPYKFSHHSPFLDGMCGTLCPATMDISAEEIAKGWRNLTAMEQFRQKWNFKFAVPPSRMNLLKFMCEKLSLSLYNIDYEKSYAVCTWMNVKRILLFSRLILKPYIREEVEKAKALIRNKHSITDSFAILQIGSNTVLELGGVDAAARKYWSMFLEARNIVPCCLRKILVMGNNAYAVDQLISGIKSLDGTMINRFAMEFISAVIIGEGRYIEPPGEQLMGFMNSSNHHYNSTSHFIEVWASLEFIAQADTVIMDDVSGVGTLVSLMRWYYHKPTALSVRNNLGDNE